MRNLIEYLLVFIVILIFCPNNHWTIGYCVFSIISYAIYLVGYLIYKKSQGIKTVQKQISLEFLIILLMMIAINLIVKIELSNLIFGYSITAIFSLITLKNFIKKQSWEEAIIKPTFLFDYYSLVYLASLILMVVNYEI